MLVLIATLPFIVFFSLIILARRSVFVSITFLLATLLVTSTTVWGMNWLRIASSVGKGTLIAFEIILIICGALLILELLKEKNLLKYIKEFFESISMDKRVHVLLIAWAVVFFLEGIAGFGAPIIIVIPLLIALGFRPITAAILAVIGDSVPVIFGAIGLPVTFGLSVPLQSFNLDAIFFHNVAVLIATINVVGSILIPLILVYTYTRIEKMPLVHFYEFVPFALLAGFSASIPSLIVAGTLGPELASIIGGICAITIISWSAKKGFLFSRTETNEKLPLITKKPQDKRNILKAIFPYIGIVVLLLLTRLLFKEILLDVYVLRISSLFGYAIDYAFNPLYSAGSILIFVSIISMIVLKVTKIELVSITRAVALKIYTPLLALVLTVSFVQIFMYSGENAQNLASMPRIMAQGISQLLGPAWPLFAPFIGALGAFASGSATVSNLIFSLVQYETAILSGYSTTLILSLQGIGAAAGNMIALHNVIAAVTVAGIVGKESYVIRKNITPLTIYLMIIGLLGLVFSKLVI